MLDVLSLFLISAGALLVTLASMLRLAWLAVIIPMLIVAAAAVGLFALMRRRPHRPSAGRRSDMPSKKSHRMAA